MKNKIATPALKAWHFLATLLFLTLVVGSIRLAMKVGLRKANPAPRVVFGASPLINSKYHSLALRQSGVDSITVVRGYFGINARDDFDIVFGVVDPSAPRWRRWHTRLLAPYVQFAKLLWQRDIFFYYFDGFYLREGGPLRWREVPALKRLGKKVVAMPYGGDIERASAAPDLVFKHAITRDYPAMAHPRTEDLVRRQVSHFTLLSDAIIAGNAADPYFIPRIDYLTPSPFCIDEAQWTPAFGPPRQMGDPFRVLHAPNHRNIKGTRFLVDAVQHLRDNGLNIELVLLEHVPNAEVQQVMARCHVVADQFIMGWHAMFGLEGMASGKPVLCYLSPEIRRLYTLYSFGGDCPLVDTPIERIADNLRWLYDNPQECERLGRLGREYVERYHSLNAFGGFLGGIVESLAQGRPFNADEYWAGRRRTSTGVEAALIPTGSAQGGSAS
ncbi:MAG: glycosyltransferase [Chloroflexi bacterium]|nr:glycosyltransferase [Chloroflexota bacterium]